MRFRKRKEEPPHERPDAEAIRLGCGASADGVVMYVESIDGTEQIFNITISPEYARDVAFKLSWYAMQFEGGNIGGGQKEGNA